MSKKCQTGRESVSAQVKKHVRALRRHVRLAKKRDPDGIHDMRVASRRLGAALSEHAGLVGKGRLKSFQTRVGRITKALGKPRELDVALGLLEDFRPQLHGAARYALLHVRRWLRRERQSVDDHVDKAVELVESRGFDGALMAVFEGISGNTKCHRRHASARLRKRYTRLCRLHEKWRADPREDLLHRIRVHFKKMRYCAETYRPVYGEGLERFIAQSKAGQQALGDWNDVRVLRDYVVAATDQAPPRAAEGLPLLISFLDERAQVLYDAAVSGLEKFFDVDSRKEAEATLRTPKAPCCNKSAKRAKAA